MKSIISVFPILLLSYLLCATQISLKDIPDIPKSILKHSQFVDQEQLSAEYWIFLSENVSFQEKLNQGRIEAQRCLALMNKSGWSLKKENRQNRGGEFIFTKEVIKQARVTVAPGSKHLDGKNKHFIFYKFEIKRLIPLKDVPGYDYPDIPRYPGSIRIRWMNIQRDYSVKYLVIDPADKVKKFFKSRLPKYNWKESQGVLNYQKICSANKSSISIPTTLSLHISEKDKITEIGIGRSAGKIDLNAKKISVITPIKKTATKYKKPVIFIDYQQDLPIYPELTKKYIATMPVNVYGQEIIRLKLETKQVEPQTALKMAEFYLKKMTEDGWQLKDEEWYGLSRKLVFEKGAVQIKINIKAVGKYPIPKKISRILIPVDIDVILPVPQKDIAGKDIERVPRYQTSIRYFYLEAGLDHQVKYKAAAESTDVEWFYIEKLPKNGWQFAGYDSTGLLFIPISTAISASQILKKGKLIPTTLKIKVDDMGNNTVKIGFTKTRGD